MNLVRCFLILLVLTFVSIGPVFSASGKGTRSGEFLLHGPNARAVALGNAYSAVADDSSATYWNPAGMIRLAGPAMNMTHNSYIDSSSADHLSFAFPLSAKSFFGIAVQHISAGEIKEMDENAVEVGDFTPRDVVFSGSYAYRLKPFAIGITGKFIRSTILDSAYTGAIDVGILSAPLISNHWRSALVLTNLGGKLKYEAEAEDLPVEFKFGNSWKITKGWLATCDLIFPKGRSVYSGVGTEYVFGVADFMDLSLRTGFFSRNKERSIGSDGYRFGAGIQFRSFGLDYAFSPYGDLGDSHNVTFNIRF
jgi:hypothetical protein